MGSRRRVVPAVVGVAMSVAALAAGSAHAEEVPGASGHGNIVSGGELRTFSFAVLDDGDGTVTGQVEVRNRALDIRVHMEVDCYRAEPGHRAIVGGVITQSSNPGLIAPGRIGVLGVEDNGSGPLAPTDRITTIPDYAPPKSCQDFTFVGDTLRDSAAPGVVVRTLVPILAGDIQVRP